MGPFCLFLLAVWVLIFFSEWSFCGTTKKISKFHSICPFKLQHGAFEAHVSGMIPKKNIELH